MSSKKRKRKRLDGALGRQLMLEGLDRVEEATDEAVKEAVREAIIEIALKYLYDFTIEELQGIVEDRGVKIPRPNVIGAITRQLIKEGWLIDTGRVRPSNRPVAHARKMTIYNCGFGRPPKDPA